MIHCFTILQPIFYAQQLDCLVVLISAAFRNCKKLFEALVETKTELNRVEQILNCLSCTFVWHIYHYNLT